MKGFMFVVAVAVFALMNTASAQIISGDANIAIVDISAAALTVTGQQEVDIVGVPGQTYNYFYSSSGGAMVLDPADGSGNAAPGDNLWDVLGTPLSNVIYTFVLPNAFQSAATGGFMPITYNNADAVSLDSDGNLFAWNPKNPSPPLNLGSGGEASIYLGFSFTIPMTAPASDDYLATFYLNAQATGF